MSLDIGLSVDDHDWTTSAACRFHDPEKFFPPRGGMSPAYNEEAKRVCRDCPVATRCLTDALIFERHLPRQHRFGVWGGMTPEERWQLVRTRRAS